MSDIGRYLDIAAFGAQVIQYTGDTNGGYAAAGYAGWIHSLTGELPTIVRGPDHVNIVLTAGQAAKVREWLDRITTGPPGKVRYEIMPVLQPWILKKAAPAGIGLFLAGAVSVYLLTRII